MRKSVWIIIEWSWKIISARCIAIKVTISTVLDLLPAMWIMRWRQVMRATTHRPAPQQEWSLTSKSYITIWCIIKSQLNRLHVSVFRSLPTDRPIGFDLRVKDAEKPSAMSRVQTLPNSHTWYVYAVNRAKPHDQWPPPLEILFPNTQHSTACAKNNKFAFFCQRTEYLIFISYVSFYVVSVVEHDSVGKKVKESLA